MKSLLNSKLSISRFIYGYDKWRRQNISEVILSNIRGVRKRHECETSKENGGDKKAPRYHDDSKTKYHFGANVFNSLNFSWRVPEDPRTIKNENNATEIDYKEKNVIGLTQEDSKIIISRPHNVVSHSYFI